MHNMLRIAMFGVLLLSGLLFTWGTAPNTSAATLTSSSSSSNSMVVQTPGPRPPGHRTQYQIQSARGYAAGKKDGYNYEKELCISYQHPEGYPVPLVGGMELPETTAYNRAYNRGLSDGQFIGWADCRLGKFGFPKK